MSGMGSPEIQAMLSGAMRGQQSLAGLAPSAQDVGGAPPGNMDPASYCFDEAHAALLKLSAELKQYRDDKGSNQVAQLAVKVKDIQLSRKAELMKASENGIGAPGGNAMSAVGGMNAMGVPGGMQ